MSSDEEEENETTTSTVKTYKCHPTAKVRLKVCLLCENVYHVSDFQRLKNTITISEVLVICPTHQEIDLNSKVNEKTLCKDAKILIAQLKLYEKDKAHNEILENISINLSEHCEKKLNKTIEGQNEDNDTVLKAEILLLRQMNIELQDKNKILKDFLSNLTNEICDLKNQEIKERNTYATAVKRDASRVKHIPTVIVKSKKDRNKNKTHKTVVNKITNDIIVPIRNIKETKSGAVLINCCTEKDVVEIKTALHRKKLVTILKLTVKN